MKGFIKGFFEGLIGLLKVLNWIFLIAAAWASIALLAGYFPWLCQPFDKRPEDDENSAFYYSIPENEAESNLSYEPVNVLDCR